MLRMKQSSLGLGNTNKRTRKREFLEEMERVVPWQALVELVAPYAPEGRRGRPPFSVEAMLRIHFMQQWFTLSDPAMEEALHDVPLFRDFAGGAAGASVCPTRAPSCAFATCWSSTSWRRRFCKPSTSCCTPRD